MKPIIRCLISFLCIASAAYATTAVVAMLGQTTDQKSDPTNANGKYLNLLYVLDMPKDREAYGGHCDWGYWTGTAWGDYTDLKPGFWVYVYPKWYIWGSRADEIGLDPRTNVQGKYSVLLHVVPAPDDAVNYGQFYDYGFSEEYEYAGCENLTPGYWVYLAPNWYVWGETSESTGST